MSPRTLHPTRSTSRGARGPAGPRRWDVVDYVTVWLVLLFGIPATQVVAPLGAIGTPALLVAAGAAFWWTATRIIPWLGADVGAQPLRIALLIWLWYQLATITLAHTRSLTALEQTGSLREAFTLICLGGLALLVMDGVESIDGLHTLLRRLVWGTGVMAAIGILQFVTSRPLVFAIPGLSAERMRGGLAGRSIFDRPYGTAMHPIEFSVVLAALLPLALYFALESAPGTRQRRWAAAASAVIALGIPLALSRSGFVTLVASMAIMALAWTWRRRMQAALVALVALPLLWLAIPGLVGTIRGMFTGLESDSSIQARLERIPKIMELIGERPLFGFGAGTYSVDDYFLVDNEFWVSIIETGIVGMTLTFGLVLLAALMAITSRHHDLATPTSRSLGYAIAAGLLGLTVSVFTFDAFFYHVLRGSLFLLLGASGALWRLTRAGGSRGTHG